MRAFIFTKYILILLFSTGLVLNRVLVYLQFVIQAEFAQLAGCAKLYYMIIKITTKDASRNLTWALVTIGWSSQDEGRLSRFLTILLKS